MAVVKGIILESVDSDKILSEFDLLKREMKLLKKYFQPKEPTQLISRLKTAKFFGVTAPTITDWTNKGILQSYSISGRIYYKLNELEAALIKIKNPMTND